MDNKKISILGAGKSGKACTRLALKMGYKVILSDISKNIKFKEKHNNLTLELGKHSEKILDSNLIIISPGISSNISIVKEAVKREIPIISEIEFASWFTKSKIIGVTGSNGKSTTVKLISEMLNLDSLDCYLCGNIGIPLMHITLWQTFLIQG